MFVFGDLFFLAALGTVVHSLFSREHLAQRLSVVPVVAGCGTHLALAREQFWHARADARPPWDDSAASDILSDKGGDYLGTVEKI